MNTITLWLVLFAVFLIVEIITAGALVSIWFCAGALVALLTAFLGGGLILQVGLFIVVSVLLLFITKPLIKKYIHPKKTLTNADAILHSRGVVKEEINNLKGEGAIAVGGKTWTARNVKDEEIIPLGREVIVVEIQGVKAMVKLMKDHKEV